MSSANHRLSKTDFKSLNELTQKFQTILSKYSETSEPFDVTDYLESNINEIKEHLQDFWNNNLYR